MVYLDLKKVSLIITKIIPEEEEYLINTKDEDLYAIKTYIRRRREKIINKLGKVSYSEWKDVPGSEREIKEELKSREETREHNFLKEYEEDKFLVKLYQSQKRKVYHMSNGDIKELKWENFGNIDINKKPLN